MKFWYFTTSLTEFFILTPWFALWIMNGHKAINRHGYVWGFEFRWKLNSNPQPGEYVFEKSISYESDFVPKRAYESR